MVSIAGFLIKIPRHIIMALIKGYQLVSAPLPPTCRFTPSCSHYTARAVETHGAIRGSWLGVKRIARCHPFSAGGPDPVPEKK